jgi:hypothetical protein
MGGGGEKRKSTQKKNYIQEKIFIPNFFEC